MKRLILSLLICLWTLPANAADRSVSQAYQFTYTITDASGAHVSGQSPTLKIEKVSNGFWYDFSSNTFKVSGWTNKTRILTENSTDGFYYYLYTPPAAETAQEQYLFIVDNSDATYPDHSSLLVKYDDIIGTINRARGR